MQKLSTLSQEQKYRLLLLAVLAASSVLCIGLFIARFTTSESRRYTSLIWNLFLAWIPFWLAWIADTSTRLPKTIRFGLVGICAFLWLIFFPNAPYLLTDFQHLARNNGNVPVWYDVLMLLWFSWSGLLLGIISLHLMQRMVTSWLGWATGWFFVLGVTILSSLGIYVGRFLRWNSWDIFVQPFSLPGQFLEAVAQEQERTLAFSLLFALFFLFVYVSLHLFGRLIQAQPAPGESLK